MSSTPAKYILAAGCLAVLAIVTVKPAFPADAPALSVQELMQSVITPATNTLWGAYQVKDDEWQNLETAAQGVIQAGESLLQGGTGSNDAANAANQDWQEWSNQMIAAGRDALAAIRNRNEEVLSSVGNDELYPPCESCHNKYMPH